MSEDSILSNIIFRHLFNLKEVKMYFRVVLLFIFSIIISGCSFTNKPTPKNPLVENNVTKPIEDNSTIIAVPESKVVTKKNKYNLKPEPFSLESNEDDPELLGPQSTLDGGLTKVKNEEDEVENLDKEPKKPIKSTQNDTNTVKEKEINSF